MESVNPTLKLIWRVKKALEQGDSVRAGLKLYLREESTAWNQVLVLWQIRLEQGKSTQDIVENQKSIYAKQLLRVLERGLKGESILQTLAHMENETQEKVEMDLEEFTKKIPYLLLLPLCLCLFPACLILMLGPFILQLMQSF